jgi:hypothetical protein
MMIALHKNARTTPAIRSVAASTGSAPSLGQRFDITEAIIIGASSSTKNADKARDPKMHQTRKGQRWYFGMKLHIGVESQRGLAHSAEPNAKDFTNQCNRRKGVMNDVLKARNRNKFKIRARAGHVFGVVKRLWGFGKVRPLGRPKWVKRPRQGPIGPLDGGEKNGLFDYARQPRSILF